MKLSNRLAILIVATTLFSTSASSQQRDISKMQVTEKQLLDAITSRTLTWLTGNSANNDYISIGRTANYFGFVAMRVASGQSLSRSDVAYDTLTILDKTQRETLLSLVNEQREPFTKSRDARLKMNRALENMLLGGTLVESRFLTLGQAYGAAEAELGAVIARRLGEVAQTLTASQLEKLYEVRETHLSGNVDSSDKKRLKLRLNQEDKKELVNIAARFLSWTTGSKEFNDFEVVGKPSQHFGFVRLRVDSNHGLKRGGIAKEIWSMLNKEQQLMLANAAAQNAELFEAFLSARAELMRTLEHALSGETIDADLVRLFGENVGRIEATMTLSQAQGMLSVRDTLSDEQSSQLINLRAKYAPINEDLSEDLMTRGRQLYAQCALCHRSGTEVSIAPTLNNIYGRAVASETSYAGYSNALLEYSKSTASWNNEALNQFLTSPKSVVPGTYMGYDGLKQPKDREALLLFLKDGEF